jgi:acyl-CoA thioesterase-1
MQHLIEANTAYTTHADPSACATTIDRNFVWTWSHMRAEAGRMIIAQQVFARLTLLAALMLTWGAEAQTIRIVALGDSNTAGFGVARQEAFPARLEAMLRMNGTDAEVQNAGISGDTTHGMSRRLDGAVPEGTRIVIIQGGYNDLRRGSSPAAVAANIEAILSRLAARQIKTVLCGFYNEPWDVMARRYGAIFVPSSTCYDGQYRGFDGLHMNAAGHDVVAARLLPVVQRSLRLPRR